MKNGAVMIRADFYVLCSEGKEGFSTASTSKVRGRRSGEAAEGTNKRSLLAVPLDRRVSLLLQ